jgi:hypothetical protein
VYWFNSLSVDVPSFTDFLAKLVKKRNDASDHHQQRPPDVGPDASAPGFPNSGALWPVVLAQLNHSQ